VLYRPYTPLDFDPLYALEELCFKPPHRFSRRYMRLLVSRMNAATWIAEEDGRLVGFAIVEWASQRNVITAYIQTIEVATDARSRGFGRELLSRIESSARDAGACLIWLHVEAANADAIRLYESQGYRRESREENYYPLGRAALIYGKRLDSDSAN
jgi:ribosomal protein S18 acetylase RimI-like enzyme